MEKATAHRGRGGEGEERPVRARARALVFRDGEARGLEGRLRNRAAAVDSRVGEARDLGTLMSMAPLGPELIHRPRGDLGPNREGRALTLPGILSWK